MRILLSHVNGRLVYADLEAKPDRLVMTTGWAYADGSGKANEPIPMTKEMALNLSREIAEAAERIGQ